MRIIQKISIGAVACIALAACSEVSTMNKLGLGKSPPDESQVVANNTLALPPDLQLPAPSASAAAAPQQIAQSKTAVTAEPPDALAPASPTTEVASAEQSPYDTGAQQLTTDGSISTAS